MAWAGSNRAQRLPANWAQLRTAVFKRDGHQCMWADWDGGERIRCTGPAEECDHVIPGDDHRMSNLRSLCKAHHGLKSAREGAAARPRMKPKKRPESKHPGYL